MARTWSIEVQRGISAMEVERVTSRVGTGTRAVAVTGTAALTGTVTETGAETVAETETETETESVAVTVAVAVPAAPDADLWRSPGVPSLTFILRRDHSAGSAPNKRQGGHPR